MKVACALVEQAVRPPLELQAVPVLLTRQMLLVAEHHLCEHLPGRQQLAS